MTIFRLRDEKLRWLESNQEVIAFDEAGAAYFGANQTGSVLWHLLAGGSTRDDLVRALVDAFGVDEERAGTDVDAFLNQLQEQGLLEQT